MLLSFFAWNCQKTYTLAPLSAIPYTVTDTPCFDSSGHTCTPTATSTPSNTFTVTQTVTPTNSPTHTATATVTNSPTPTATPTQTGTPTFTGTPTNTRTVTATGTPTNSPSPTATATVTSTTTATWMPTPPFISSGWSTFNDAPNGLAEGNGYIYVAEGDGASISIVQLLNAGNNASVTQWTGYSGINFLYPTGVAVNPTTGSVYVLDQGLEQSGTTNGSAVYEFGNSPAPAGVTTWTGYGGTAFNFPSGIAVDSTGNVYVTDQDNFELEEFSSGGTTLAEWNDNNNSYFYPAAVAVDSSNNLYVVDAGNYVVWKLSSISGTVSSWPILPSSSYDTPFYGVGVDSSGNVFVADYTNNLVEVYSGGNLIGEMTGESGTPFSEPDAVLLYNNDIYVANYENSAGIQIFGPNNY